MLLYSIFFFSFYGYAHHRDLHSFPTRRSSDLASISRWTRRSSRPSQYPHRRPMTIPAPVPIPTASTPTQSEIRLPWTTRSEEHTSELQSPDHLVCRLLLEKKKKKTNIHVMLIK